MRCSKFIDPRIIGAEEFMKQVVGLFVLWFVNWICRMAARQHRS